MKTRIFSFILALFMSLFAFSPLFNLPALAVDCGGQSINGVPLKDNGDGVCVPDSGSSTLNTPGSLIIAIINIMLELAFSIAVLFIIIGGYKYIFSAGNSEAADSGRKTLTNAVIGVAIIILSFAIVNIVNQTISKVTH